MDIITGDVSKILCPESSFYKQIFDLILSGYMKGYDHLGEKPRWGFVELILVYLGILFSGFMAALLGNWFPIIKTGFGTGEIGFFLFAFIIQFIMTIGLIYLIVVKLLGGSWSELGVKATAWRNYLIYGVLGGLLLIVIVTLLGFWIKQYQPELPPQYYEVVLRSAGGLTTLLVIFIGAVLAPFSEELFYRGMVYPVFKDKLGVFWGAAVAGLVFGLVHWDLWRAIPLAIGGAILCYIYEKTDSIWASTIAHGVWNGLMSLVVYLSIGNGAL